MSSLSYFMKPELKEDVIIEIPGLEAFKDEYDQIIPFKIKLLTPRRIGEIRKMYTKARPILDQKGKPQFRNGRPLTTENTDDIAAQARMFIESFIFPDLKSPELREYYGVDDNEELVERMFFRDPKTMNEVVENWSEAHGIDLGVYLGEDPTQDEVEEAKNT